MAGSDRREREKAARKEEIITAAEELFQKDGVENVSIEAIARKADFAKRTIYHYFTNKEDLYFAVALRSFKTMAATIGEDVNPEANGLDKIMQFMRGYYRFYLENPLTFQLMNQIGRVKIEETPERRNWMEFDDRLFEAIADVIRGGQKDGSIRKDLDPVETARIHAFLTTGFIRQLSETGHTFTTHFKMTIDELVDGTIDYVRNALAKK